MEDKKNIVESIYIYYGYLPESIAVILEQTSNLTNLKAYQNINNVQ